MVETADSLCRQECVNVRVVTSRRDGGRLIETVTRVRRGVVRVRVVVRCGEQ